MKTFSYNDMTFSVEASKDRWDISYVKPDGSSAFLGAGLFPGVAASEVVGRSLALVKSILPVGIKIVGPDTAHPNLIGDLKIVGPDVSHPNFIYWNKDSSSFAR